MVTIQRNRDSSLQLLSHRSQAARGLLFLPTHKQHTAVQCLLSSVACQQAVRQHGCLKPFTPSKIQTCGYITQQAWIAARHMNTHKDAADGCVLLGYATPPSMQVFLGDQSVGKTSIITRFMYDKFDNTYQVGCL